jgi:hypothetical protein
MLADPIHVETIEQIFARLSEGWMYRGIKMNHIPVITGKAFCVEPFNQRNLW